MPVVPNSPEALPVGPSAGSLRTLPFEQVSEMTGVSSPTPSSSENPPPNPIVRVLDRVIVAAIRVLIVLATLKSRDPRARTAHVLKPDRREHTRIRHWEGVLAWSPGQRVGCFLAVLFGIALGGSIIWWGIAGA
jgi:hypothetical protein